MNKYKIAIIGGGFSGLCAAVMLGQKCGKDLVVCETGARVGKKILATGNGRGNITNLEMDKRFYHGSADFANNAISRFGNIQLMDFFFSLGLVTVCEGRRVYPASLTASSICDVLRFKLEEFGVTVKTDCRIEKTEFSGGSFILYSKSEKFASERVIAAFGGHSGAGFNTDGTSYSLLSSYGHKVTDLSPSLVQLVCERDKIRGLKGLKVQAETSLYSCEHLIRKTDGDLLFTDYGVSGNSIFELSASLRGVKNPRLEIAFLPYYSEKDLYEVLCKKINGVINVERLLVSVFPTRLSAAILKQAQIDLSEQADDDKARSIAKTAKRFTLKIERAGGFDCSQVTAGGIDTRFINEKTMESKLRQGLFVIGEALDVDGDCGGYNLQWAFSSAAACAQHILNGDSQN